MRSNCLCNVGFNLKQGLCTMSKGKVKHMQLNHGSIVLRKVTSATQHLSCWRSMDFTLLSLLMLLLGIGLIMLLSASFPSAYYELRRPTYYFTRQLLYAALGIFAMLAISLMDYHLLKKIARPLLLISLLLLFLVLIPGIGEVRNNARRWISIGGLFTFQPSEIVKLAVILDFSASIAWKKNSMHTWKQGVKPYICILLIIAVLMIGEPHLSGTILIIGTGIILMTIGGIHWKWIAIGLAAIVAAVVALITGAFPYGQSRIAMWRDPFIDASGAGYQLAQSLIAIGSGGLTGIGLGKSRQKFLYLPEEHNDFIFAIVCEELGFIGAAIILLVFMAVIVRGYWIALQAPDRFGLLLVVGVISLFAMQTFFNVAVVTGLFPTTGISLPFFSYGGTALCLQLLEMGIVLSVSKYRRNVSSRESQ